ncbi:MAG: S-adenosylmethionine:tRNA ribosyltransferase-isomerase [Bacteroidetes bacterium]|nr:S-adenosylmethionine:tRNA ribosyltransferase-isomerase [Bacteroidota bacterium]
MRPKEILIKDFTYQLPEEKIAAYPLQQRDASKLLIYQKGVIKEDVYANIAEHLPENSLLVFNNTKVIEARIPFKKPTGASIEIFCLEPHVQYKDITSAMATQKKVLWKCLIGGASKWKPGQVLEKRIIAEKNEFILCASYIEKLTDCFIIELSWQPENLSFAEILHYAGSVPLPPYIKREVAESDTERYQTIYAKHDGSVAAPTAGLHFTNSIFQELTGKNIRREFVTLHVGAGTFKPVKTETIQEHDMHVEFIEIRSSTLHTLIENSEGTIISVGTTSLRTIESLYWLGLKCIKNPDIKPEELVVHQWDAYELHSDSISAKTSLQSLLSWMGKNKIEKLITKTQLLIVPGYTFRVAKILVTNFHQPQSTLLLLVAAFIGDDWKKVYDYALNNNFRFLSYGDGCLLFRNEAMSYEL